MSQPQSHQRIYQGLDSGKIKKLQKIKKAQTEISQRKSKENA
jgi:hypothetical protein|tara:strand:+ start:220 stop:345 length:126 start_codon:yes stop_codon:yes gene_type:complete